MLRRQANRCLARLIAAGDLVVEHFASWRT
jgi:hypothetical protein